MTDQEKVKQAQKWAGRRAEAAECSLPPPGWNCTRGEGHPGPCAASPVAVKLPKPQVKLRPPSPDQLWLRLGSGIVLISEVAAVVQLQEEDKSLGQKWPPKLLDRGVELTLKSGQRITAPDAVYSEVQLALYAAQVGA